MKSYKYWVFLFLTKPQWLSYSQILNSIKMSKNYSMSYFQIILNY